MKSYNLVDSAFAHIGYSAPGVSSEHWKWDRTLASDSPTFYTHEMMFDELKEGEKYGLLIESQAIIPAVYNHIKLYPSKMHQFKKVFTHSSYLIQNLINAWWIPGGSIWVGGEYGGGEIKIYQKTKNCSMVSSGKTMCKLHNFRKDAADWLSTQNTDIDFYGTQFGKWTPIIDSLADYRFSICIENHIDELYFTEKLLNCFATGTIPIYLGATNIGSIFNTKGMLCFSKPGQLLDTLAEFANEDFYNANLDAVKDNFERCQKFKLLEDYLWKTYF